jgi:phosphoserine phosphatase RsbU/P
MVVPEFAEFRAQLLERRQRLEATISYMHGVPQLVLLLKQVDAALNRMDDGKYGICEVCHDPIEKERLRVDPLVCVCLDHMTETQQHALEQDMELASKIQSTLLPQNSVLVAGWEIQFHFAPAGPVSGDYCDLLSSKNAEDGLFFVLGDVSGKGLAASMLVSHLHAMFHSLISVGLPSYRMLAEVNRLLCESTLATHYATLVCGQLKHSGEIELCNAGHVPPFLAHKNEIERIDATGLPLGLFQSSEYSIQTLKANPGDTLLLYTDGLCEAVNATGEYGIERIGKLVRDNYKLPPKELIHQVLQDLNVFMSGKAVTDDLTVMAIRRT